MNRFNYPFTRIITKPIAIKNNRNLQLNEVVNLMGEDKTLQKIKTLKHFYPQSEGKPIFRHNDSIWLIIDSVTNDHITITSVQKDNALYSFFAFIAFGVLMSLFFSGVAFAFIVFSLMVFGIVVISNKVTDSHLKAKIFNLRKSINNE